MPSRTHQPIKIAHNHPPDLPKIQQVIVTWAVSPSRTPYSVRSLSKATPETALALAIDAVLKARPIAHDRSQSAANAQIRAGYYDIRKLAGSSPEERAAALKHGGYNIYRERASANLGYLAQVVDGVYGAVFPFSVLYIWAMRKLSMLIIHHSRRRSQQPPQRGKPEPGTRQTSNEANQVGRRCGH